MNRKLHIARLETDLGLISDGEAIELLEAGFLQPGDLFRIEDEPEWKPLSKLRGESHPAEASTLRRVQAAVVSAGSLAAPNSAKLAQKLHSSAAKGQDRLAASSQRLLESFVPQIRSLIENQLIRHSVTRVQDAFKDRTFMQRVFGATYDCLPKPVRRFVTEEAFIAFCFESREKLFGPTAK